MTVVFIGMECSGQLRRRFQNRGCFTISADLKPAEDSQYPESTVAGPIGGHIQDDVFSVLDYLRAKNLWPDVAIFHPDCTYLTNSAAWAFGDGPYHQRVKPGTLVGGARRAARGKALADVERIDKLPITKKVVENPIGSFCRACFENPTRSCSPICSATTRARRHAFGFGGSTR